MNKNFIHRFSTIIAVIIVIPLAILSIAASVTKAIKDNNENDVPPGPPVVKKPIQNGYYSFEHEISLGNLTYFVEDSELFEYFHTKDLNGVKSDVIFNKGFNTFCKKINHVDDKEKYIKFVDNKKASSYIFDNNDYSLVNEDEFIFEYKDSEYVSTGINPIIKAETDKKVTLYFPFYYEDEEGTIVITPLYVEATLVLIEEL